MFLLKKEKYDLRMIIVLLIAIFGKPVFQQVFNRYILKSKHFIIK